MRFHVLGPVEVRGDAGDQLAIAGSKERTVLAKLIASVGLVVAVDDLIDELWGEDPPRTAEKTLGSYISRLRKTLDRGMESKTAASVIISRGAGYILERDGHEFDAFRFEELARQGRDFLERGDADAALPVLDEALGLWRGAAYQDVRYTRFGAIEGDRLDELRRSALEDHVDARLAIRSEATLVAELEGMVRAEPLRERRWGQLMLALYRQGRQAQALETFHRARDVLASELGIDPGPSLQAMQAAILRHDVALDAPSTSGVPTARVRRIDVCPYKGLVRFETSDSEYFFGREQLVDDAVAALVTHRFLGLVGASGSGKSSLLRAGILVAIERGALPGSDRWATVLLRPGAHPMASLYEALRGSTSDDEPLSSASLSDRRGQRIVLAVDQFEEVFTECGDDGERVSFLDALTEATTAPDGDITVVVAMRADYYVRCAEHRPLAALLSRSQLLVGPMDADELRRAIVLPAERAHLEIEGALTDALVRDVEGRPGGLPLLSTELLVLWGRRRDGVIHVEDYLRSGGVGSAVARLAEEAYGRLDSDEQRAARRILLRMAEASDGDEVVSRRAPLEEFDLPRDPAASRALDALVAARLVAVSHDIAEVAHEALFREWPRLRTWIDEDAHGRRLHRHLAEAATSWAESGRDDGDLYRGARLSTALDWAETHEPDVNQLEREFLSLSRDASEGQASQVRRTNRRLRGLLAGVAALLVVSLVVGNLALKQRDQARDSSRVADARQLASRSLVEEDPVLSALLARQAVDLYDSPETRSALLAGLQRAPAVVARMYSARGRSSIGDQTQWVAISPDGGILAIGDASPAVDFFDTARSSRIGVFTLDSGTRRGAFSPDSATLALATTSDEIVLVDVRRRSERARVSTEGRHVEQIGFAPDGSSLVSAESSREGTFLVRRDPVALQPVGPAVDALASRIAGLAFSADGTRLVTTGGGRTVLWDANQLRRIHTFHTGSLDVQTEQAANDVAVSRDGSVAALIRNDVDAEPTEGDVSFLDLRTGDVLLGSGGHRGVGDTHWEATGVAFLPDGESVVTTGNDSRVLVWDVASATVTQSLAGSSDLQLRGPAVSPDATTVFATDRAREVVAWDLEGDGRLDRPFVAGPGYEHWPWFGISADGSTLAIMGSDNGRSSVVDLVDTATLTTSERIRYRKSKPQGVDLSPDGNILAVGSWSEEDKQGHVRLWNAASGKPLGPDLPGVAPGFAYWAMAFSPDGTILASGSNLGGEDYRSHISFWDVAAQRLLPPSLELGNAVNNVSFTPDGAYLVAGTGTADRGDVVFVDMVAQEIVARTHADDVGVWWTDVSDNGRLVVTGGQSSGVQLWDPTTWQPVGVPLAGIDGTVDTVSLSPDGTTVVAASQIGELLMWDVDSGEIIGRPFPGPTGGEDVAASFMPDGRHMVVVSETGSGWLWDLDPSSWATRACRVAGRTLTRAEWDLYLPGRAYEPSCRT